MKKSIVIVALLATALSVSAAEGEATGAAGVVQKVEGAVVRGAKAAASGVERGASAAVRGVKIGVEAAARGVEKGAQATARVAGGVADKVHSGSAPSKPAGNNANNANNANWPPDRASN